MFFRNEKTAILPVIHNYFVSYVFSKDNQLTFGHCTIHRDKKMDTSDEIQSVAKLIAEKNEKDGMVTIISFVKLKEEME